jgi:hypothetical protein
MLLFFSLAMMYFIRSDWRVHRYQGILAVASYVAFIAAAYWQGWG